LSDIANSLDARRPWLDVARHLRGWWETRRVTSGLLRGIAIFRLVALAIVIGTLVTERSSLKMTILASVLVALTTVATLSITWLNLTKSDALTSIPVVGGELLIGAALLLFDGLVFRTGHVGSTQSGLAGSWPIAGVLSAGVAMGPWIGLVAGSIMGIAHVLAAPLNGVSLKSSSVLAVLTSFVLYAIYGVAAGYAVRVVHAYDETLSRTRARDEVSRTLHDGVLQTLAVIERRSGDPELSALAREQERDLRAFLSDIAREQAGPFAAASVRRKRVAASELRASIQQLVSRQLRHSSTRSTVFVAEDTPPIPSQRADAVLGAVSEALANVAKHAAASNVTIFVEPFERKGLFCSVKDDGVGFDVDSVVEGFGMTNSIRRRIDEIGGRVELVGRDGIGTEVKLWA
jgi:signal transduction histidine kinase